MPNSKLVASMYEQGGGSSSLPASQLRRDILLLSSVCSHWIIHKGEEDTVRLLGHYRHNEKKGDCFKVSTGKVEALIIHGSWAACCNIVVPLKMAGQESKLTELLTQIYSLHKFRILKVELKLCKLELTASQCRTSVLLSESEQDLWWYWCQKWLRFFLFWWNEHNFYIWGEKSNKSTCL